MPAVLLYFDESDLNPVLISSHTEKKQEWQGAGALAQHLKAVYLSTGCRGLSDT